MKAVIYSLVDGPLPRDQPMKMSHPISEPEMAIRYALSDGASLSTSQKGPLGLILDCTPNENDRFQCQQEPADLCANTQHEPRRSVVGPTLEAHNTDPRADAPYHPGNPNRPYDGCICTMHLSHPPLLFRRRLLQAIEHQHVERRLARIERQPQLLHGGEDRGAGVGCGVGRMGRVGA